MKEDLKMNPWNQNSMNLTLISQRNWRLKWGDFSKMLNHEINEIKNEIQLNYDSKRKLNTKQR